jgi:hypothetical protein
VAGFRVAVYAQTIQNKVDEFEYASKNRVIKTFVSLDWNVYNKKGRLITVHSLDGLADPPAKMKLTFQIQKNHQNGQKKYFVADNKHLDICLVRAAYPIFLQAKRLGQTDDQPMGVFVNHQGITKYLTASKIAKVLQSFAKICHPDLTRDEIMRFTSHSIRVWAVVLLDKAGMNTDFIESRHRWIGDSYR